MIKEHLGQRVDRLVLRVTPFVTRIPLTPDQLTLLGVGVSALVGAAYTFGAVRLAGVLLILAGACDLIDGIVARARGTDSRAGSFFDSTMDRVSDLLILSGIVIGAARTGSPWLATLACWALAGSVLTSYARARAEVELGEFSVGWMERAERMLVLLFFSLVDQLAIGLWVIALGSTATTVVRILTALRRIDAAESRAPTTPPPVPTSDGSPDQPVRLDG